MRNKKTFIGIALLIAVLLIGIGYASMSGDVLNIKGNISAETDDANFVVKFVDETTQGAVTVTNNVGADVTATVTDDTNAVLNVSKLTTKDQTITVAYTVQNASKELSAKIAAEVVSGNKDGIFEVTAVPTDTTVTAENTTTVIVTVKLLKTPITAEDVAAASTSLEIKLTATPQQPSAN